MNPTISAYKVLNGLYNWDWYPLAPPGCKAIIYKALAVQGSWALQGTNAWFLGPLKDHFQCNLFYFPMMWAYRISGSADLFLQHCQVPNLSPTKHLYALTSKVSTETTNAVNTPKGKALIKILRAHLDALIALPPVTEEQRETAGTFEEPIWDLAV
jgi:hypothetical protein